MTEQQGPWPPPDLISGPAPGVEFGEFGPRLVAYLIDAAIVGALIVGTMLVWAMLAFFGGQMRTDSMDPGAWVTLAIVLAAVTVFGLGYFPWFWSRTGATPGMKMMGLRVVRDADGGPISGGQAILRLVGYWVSGLVLYLGYIWILVDKRRRGWHDLIAGTVVIKAP